MIVLFAKRSGVCHMLSLQDSRSTGLTLALLDLQQMDTNFAGGLDATLNELSVALEAQMRSTPGEQQNCCAGTQVST